MIHVRLLRRIIFLEHLQTLRGTKEGPSKIRRTKLAFVPGRSLGESKSETPSDADTDEQIEESYIDEDKENFSPGAVDFCNIKNYDFLLVNLEAKTSSRCFVA